MLTAETFTECPKGSAGISPATRGREARTAELGSGVVLPFFQQGPENGPAVIFLHGITDSRRSFEGVMAHLPASVRAVAPTLRGHRNAGQPCSYRLEDFSMDIAALLDVLAIRRATIVGHSMGASVAQRLALDHPDRVQGLVLIGAFAALGRNLELAAFGKGSMLTLTDPIDPAFVQDFQKSTLARPIPDAMLAGFVAESLAVPAAVWSAAWAALVETDFTPELAKIAAPTLLIRGEEDTMALAAEQDIMQAAIPDCRLTVLKGGGHAPHWEDPAEVASLIARFMGARGEGNVGQRPQATGDRS